MPPMHSGDTGDGQGDDGDEGVEFRPPLPPEDRIWRHPSEVATADLPAPALPRTVRRRTPRVLGVAVVSGLIGATLSLGVVAAMGGFSPESRVVERNVAVQPVTSLHSGSAPISAIVTRSGPTIAAVRVDRDRTTATGSAIVLRSDGHLLTDAALVDGADAIEVRFHEGSSTAATVVGTDAATDVAVLRVDVHDLRPAALGTAEALQIGDEAVALAATDAAGWTTEVSTGIVSSLDRRVRGPDGQTLHGMMMIDVPLPHVRAGGALLDTSGAVVGIMSGTPSSDPDQDTERPDDEPSYCVVTPIDVAAHIADEIIEHGHARHVWLGVEGSDLQSADATDMGVAGGAEIRRVLEASPAASSGLADGDVIVGLDGRTITSMSDLIAALRTHAPGEEVTVTVQRGDDALSVRVVLAEKGRD